MKFDISLGKVIAAIAAEPRAALLALAPEGEFHFSDAHERYCAVAPNPNAPTLKVLVRSHLERLVAHEMLRKIVRRRKTRNIVRYEITKNGSAVRPMAAYGLIVGEEYDTTLRELLGEGTTRDDSSLAQFLVLGAMDNVGRSSTSLAQELDLDSHQVIYHVDKLVAAGLAHREKFDRASVRGQKFRYSANFDPSLLPLGESYSVLGKTASLLYRFGELSKDELVEITGHSKARFDDVITQLNRMGVIEPLLDSENFIRAKLVQRGIEIRGALIDPLKQYFEERRGPVAKIQENPSTLIADVYFSASRQLTRYDTLEISPLHKTGDDVRENILRAVKDGPLNQTKLAKIVERSKRTVRLYTQSMRDEGVLQVVRVPGRREFHYVLA